MPCRDAGDTGATGSTGDVGATGKGLGTLVFKALLPQVWYRLRIVFLHTL